MAYTSKDFYETSLATIDWLSIAFMVTALPCGFGAVWFLDTISLRLAVILGAWLNFIGCLFRVVSAVPGVAAASRLPLVFVGQVIASLAQPLLLFAPTKLAALWFPVDQRATANILATICELDF